MQDFVDGLVTINAVADASPGFIWRLKDDSGDATAVQALADETILINMSVWASPDALKDFVYGSEHLQYLRNKKKWFAPYGVPNLVLWWVKRMYIPTVAEGKERLHILTSNEPCPEAFNLATVFMPPVEDE